MLQYTIYKEIVLSIIELLRKKKLESDVERELRNISENFEQNKRPINMLAKKREFRKRKQKQERTIRKFKLQLKIYDIREKLSVINKLLKIRLVMASKTYYEFKLRNLDKRYERKIMKLNKKTERSIRKANRRFNIYDEQENVSDKIIKACDIVESKWMK